MTTTIETATYNPLADERLVAIALKAILQSDLQCHSDWEYEQGEWDAAGEFQSTWTWADTRRDLAEFEHRFGSGTEFLWTEDSVLEAMPDVSSEEQHAIAKALYTHLSALIDKMTLEQACRLSNSG